MSSQNINDSDEHGTTKLHLAALKGDFLEVKQLVANGADINCRTVGLIAGETVLQISASNGDLEIVRFLFQNGANIDAEDGLGWTPLCYAARYGHVLVVEFLAFQSAKIRKRNRHGEKPLHFVLNKESANEMAEILLLFGAQLNAVNKRSGETALMIAIRCDSIETVRLLLELNANTMIADVKGWNVLQTENKEIKRLLLEHLKKSEKEREQIRQETLNRIRGDLGLRLMRYAQSDIIGYCLAMSLLELPPYVLLWIIDWLPHYDKLSHRKKIQLIENVRNSIWKIQGKHDQ